MESGLIFNQLNCEFESRHPCQTSRRMLNVTTCAYHARFLVALSAWVVAQLAEHRTVTATVEGSIPFDPPNK